MATLTQSLWSEQEEWTRASRNCAVANIAVASLAIADNADCGGVGGWDWDCCVEAVEVIGPIA